jgi:hypothetical protein
LNKLLEKLPPDDAEDGKYLHLPSNNKPSGSFDSGGPVHWSSPSPPDSQILGLPPIIDAQQPSLFDVHTDWFDTYTFPDLDDRGGSNKGT